MNETVLEERYQWVLNTPSDVVEHIPTFVKAVEEMKPLKIVELGVRYGISTLAWIHALHKQGSGHLWAVDCSWPFYVVDEKLELNLLDPQGPLGMVSEWTFILGYDTDWAVINALPDDIDILFLDTNHVYEETLIELEIYYPKMQGGGKIFLHDSAIEDTGNRGDRPKVSYPVLSAVREFCAENNLQYKNVENCYGLATIYC